MRRRRNLVVEWLPSVILFFVGFIFHEQIFAFFGYH